MNTHANLFEKTCSFARLDAAYRRARCGKGAREEVARFGFRLEANLLSLRDELRSGTYAHGGYRAFTVNDSKKRQIKAAPFRDRVVHHALCATLEPLFERGFIADSYACRRAKGTHAALAAFERYARVSRYALSLDISKYFASIDHAILYARLARKVRDPQLLSLCRIIIESAEDAPGCGIPIGNLTSQLFANIYLDALDHYVKHALHVRRYVRYMDDMMILGDDKKALHEIKEQIRAFAGAELHLTLHPHKAQVAPTSQGIGFLGYRVFPRHRRLRASTVQRFVARTKRARNSCSSSSCRLNLDSNSCRLNLQPLQPHEIAGGGGIRKMRSAHGSAMRKALARTDCAAPLPRACMSPCFSNDEIISNYS